MRQRLIIAAVVLSFFCSAAVCSAKTFDTPYFRLNLPDHFTTATPPPEVTGDQTEGFSYAFFIEKEKGKAKSIVIIVAGEKMSDKARTMRDRALTGTTDELRKSITKSSKCEGELSDVVRTRIGNSDALYFEKTNRNCMVLTERYWTAIGSEYFITYSIYRIADADVRIYDQCVEAIGKVVLK